MSGDLTEAEVADQEAVEIRIAECMVSEGFQYVPVDFGSVSRFDGDDLYGGLPYASQEWVERYGFGITTLLAIDTASTSIASPAPLAGSQEEYLASLSAGDREAYDRALNGDEPDSPGGRERSGCIAESQSEAFEDRYLDYVAYLEAFSSLLQTLDTEIETDPRVVADARRGAECLTEQAVQFVDGESVTAYLMDQAADIEIALEAWRGSEIEIEVIVEEGDGDLIIGEPTMRIDGEDSDSPEDGTSEQELIAVIDAAHNEEIRLAKAFIACDVTVVPVHWSAIYLEVRDELERAFIDEHATELEGFRLPQDN